MTAKRRTTGKLAAAALALLLALSFSAQAAAEKVIMLTFAGDCVIGSEERNHALPESFDLRSVDTDGDGVGDRCYVPPVRQQNPFGTCWGFAATAASEAAGRFTTGSAALMISGFFTPISFRSSSDPLSLKVIMSAVLSSTFAASFLSRGLMTGPMPQPYMMTRQPSFFAAQRVKR